MHRAPDGFGTAAARRGFGILVFVVTVLLGAASARAQVPTDFVDDLILGGVSGQPVAIAFLPDGRLLFNERTGARIRLLVNGAISAVDPMIVVPNVDVSSSEGGLLGIAVDPGWPATPYIYIHYTYLLSNNIRISRYTVGGDLSFTGNGALTIDPSTRYDILTDPPDNAFNHNGGTVRFGPDGKLYVSIGDDASSCQAQNLTILAGKILRLDVSALPAGGGGPPTKSLITPADNPYVGNANANAKLVGYWGLRNPFRFAMDPLTGALVIGDVGQNTQEELDHVSVLGANLQWPIYEGQVPFSTCVNVDSTTFTEPILIYPRSQGQAVNGGALYRRPASGANRFPPEYEGDIFYSDFYRGYLRRLSFDGLSWNPEAAPGQPNATDWATVGGAVADYAVAPDGSLWYCRMQTGTSGPGDIRRIRYTGVTSVPPPGATPIEFRAPYPSPSSSTTSFAFTLSTAARVTLTIYDAAGRRVRVLLEPQVASPGPHGAIWDGTDASNRSVGAGLYIGVLTVDEQRLERRFTVLR